VQVSYCERWNYARGRPLGPLTEEQARARHDAGELYTAVLGDPERPDAIVEVRLDSGYVRVAWLDDRGLETMAYTFAGERKEGRLFLQEVRLAQHDDDREVMFVDATRFHPDGRWTAAKTDLASGETLTAEGTTDVEANWEPVPPFGDYASAARVERYQPPDQRPTG
jgi:hypothetical protein